MLDFRIETFIMVCELMNFTKAAERLNITQPAVSQHIRYLEEKYETKLFKYTGKKMKLTEQGRILLNASVTMHHDELHMKQRIKDAGEAKQRISFGATLTIGEFLMPERVYRFLNENPKLSLSMIIANTYELLDKLERGELDFAIVEGYFKKNEYDHMLYARENYIAVCAPENHLATKSIELEEIFKENLIVREKGSGTREILEKILQSRNYDINDFNNVIEISNINVIKNLTQKNCGITFLYEAAAASELNSGALKKMDLKDTAMEHDMMFLWRKNSIFADYYKNLFEELK